MAHREPAELSLFISEVEARVHCPLPDAMAALSELWAGCRVPMVPATSRVRIEVGWVDGDRECSILLDGQLVAVAEQPADVVPLIESALYKALHAQKQKRAILHAACVVIPGCDESLLFVGPSGAGKSSMALAAVERGYRYVTDELTVTDGERLWGVTRAIQFEPVHASHALPPRLAASDLGLYAVRMGGLGDQIEALGAVPVRVPVAHELVLHALPVRATRIVRIERGTNNKCEVLSPLDALSELHEASFEPPAFSLGTMVGRGRAFRLVWRDPSEGLALLERMIMQTPAPSIRPPV
jgi:hypothetical protein